MKAGRRPDISFPADSSSLGRTVRRGIGLAGAGHLVTQGITFASYVVLARILVPADFGRFAAGSILVGFGMLFVDSGMLAALVSRRERIEEAANTALLATIAGGVALGLVGLAASPLIALYFRSREIGFVAAAMSASFILRQATIVPNAILQRNLSFFRRVVCEPAAACAFGATAIAASSTGMGMWSLVLGQYASYVTDVVLSWMLVPWRPNLGLASLAMWRELIRFGKFVTFAELLQRTSAEASTALVGRFIGTPALGLYQYAFRIAERPATALTDSISYVLYPAFARISGDEARFRAAVLRALRWTSVVALPASLIFLPLGKSLVVILFGQEWREAGRAVEAMCAFTAGATLMSLAAHVAAAAGRPEIVLRVQVLSALLVVSSMVALLHFGVIGVAIALSVATLGTGIYSLVWISRLIRAPAATVLCELLPSAAAAIVMAVTLYPIDHAVVTPLSHGTAVAVLLLLLEGMFALAIFIPVLGALAPGTIREFVTGVRTRRVPQTESGVSSHSDVSGPAGSIDGRPGRRLLVVSYLAKDRFAPRGIRTRELLKELRRDWEIDLLCADRLRAETPASVTKARLPKPLRSLIHAVLIDPEEIWSIRHLWPFRFRRGRNPRPEAALLIGYPFSPLAYASARLARRGIPYIVDLGDPWALTARHPTMSGLALLRSRRAEKRMWEAAAGAIVTTAAQARALLELFPRLEVLVRPNGFDPPPPHTVAAGNRRPDDARDALRLVHFGTIYDVRVDIKTFLEKLSESGLWERVEFHQYGLMVSLRDTAGVSLVVHEPRPWHEVISLAGAYDAALVIGNLDGRQMPSKTVEYLLLPIPRLAVTLDPERDAVADYVADKPGWLVLRPDDADAAERLRAHVDGAWPTVELLPPSSETWKSAAGQIRRFLWDVVGGGQTTSSRAIGLSPEARA